MNFRIERLACESVVPTTSEKNNVRRDRPRVAVVYTHVPHYREPVFTELTSNSDMIFEIYTSMGTLDSTIKEYSGNYIDRSSRLLKFGPFLWQTKLHKIVLRRELDAVIFLGNPYILSTWVYAIISRVVGRKKVMFWTHGWTRAHEGVKGSIRAAFYRMAHGLLLYGDRAREIGQKKGFNARSLFTIYNSLDYNLQAKCRSQVITARGEVPDNSAYYVSIGRLVPELELELAVRALGQMLRDRRLRIPLVVIGDGPERDRLVEAAAAEGVEVRFLGAMYDEAEIAPILSGALALVSPGKVGLAAMHSLAYGVPVITHGDLDHQMPEVEAVRPGITGEFFRRGDASSLASMLARWAERRCDVQARQIAIGDIEERYTPERQRVAIEGAVYSVIGRRIG